MSLTGTVLNWHDKRGFGFLRRDDGCEHHVFLHASDVQRSGLHGVEVGQRVQFDLKPGRNGVRDAACNVRVVNDREIIEGAALLAPFFKR